MDNRWYRILAYWIDHEGHQTLTIPFLVGALREPIGDRREKDGRREVETLIDAIRSFKASGAIFHVYRCHNLDKFVLTRVIGSTAPHSKSVAIPNLSRDSPPVLFASDNAAVADAPVESLGEAIWNEGGTAIQAGLFSCRGTMFQRFEVDELRWIRAALATPPSNQVTAFPKDWA